jgi:tRNA-Thr(GGU) m(6)t(6)A37 methyltransferase TsaA
MLILDYHTTYQMIELKPIGVVHNAMMEAHRDTRWQEIESEIEIDAEWHDALDGVGQFSHIWVVTYLDRMPEPDALHVHPTHDARLPLVGIFATRSPQRPNPIGICAVELLKVRGNVIRVRGLDALNGTPVLDIKPYLTGRDLIENTRVGEWVKQLNALG